MPEKGNEDISKIFTWKLSYNRFQPVQEGLREALCTLGNGYLGVRGAIYESSASRVHYPGTYIAGVYNELPTLIAGKKILNEDFVNCPNWLPLTFRTEKGDWVSFSTSKILFYHQQLDFRRGVLIRKVRIQDDNGQITTIETERIVHLVDPHCAAIKYTIIPENYEGFITIKSALDGTVQNTGVPRYRQLNSKHLMSSSLGSFDNNGVYLAMKTTQSKIEICQAAKNLVSINGKKVKSANKVLTKKKEKIEQEFKVFVRKQQHCKVEKIVSIYTSKDKDVINPLSSAINSVKKSPGFNTLFEIHQCAWKDLWKKFDIQIEGDAFSQKALRLHIFHLLQTASIHNTKIDAGLPARGLHGEAYRGHIFWDELFVMSFFDFHSPEISKALLLYRYRRLIPARKSAKKSGYKGAMFPWQSGSDGKEKTQFIHLNPMSGKWGPDHTYVQRHVSFAIAYNVWQYWKKSNDLDFLIDYGAEMLLSIAQFGASLAQYDVEDSRYHTHGLMGPDEFHEKVSNSQKPGFKDNAYTNLLIVRTLLKAKEVINVLPLPHRTRIIKKLKLDQTELLRWKDITRKMNVIINKEGIIGQFDGYFKLKELNWDAYRRKYDKVERMDRILKAEGKSPNDYKAAKQADVLMLFYLFPLFEIKDLFHRLGYRFDRYVLKRNYEYYVKRTSHGSSLSKIVHCYVAYLLGRSKEGWQWFSGVLKSDIYDVQGGTTVEGIHAGIMGGSIDMVIRGFAGIYMGEEIINITPNLPSNWQSLRFKFCYKGNWFSLFITKEQLTIFISGSPSKSLTVPVKIHGKLYHFLFRKKYTISLEKNIKGKGSLKMTQKRILIVDGNITQTERLKTKLQAMGYLIDCAHTGKEALDILETKWVDLIISAIIFQGGMNGFQFFKEVKKRKRLSKIPIAMQSSKAAMKGIFEIMGADTFFVKPYSMDLFLDEVKNILAGKALLSKSAQGRADK